MPPRSRFAVALVATVWLGGCSTVDEPFAVDPLPGPSEWNREVSAPGDEEAAAKRASCAYKKGMLPAETLGESHPLGQDIPIDHILVVMMENRSFDHYFQKLPEFGQSEVDVAPEGFSNPDTMGKPVKIYRDTNYCFVDTSHSWSAVHEQVNQGKMDGFVRTNEGHHELPANGNLEMIAGKRAMSFYDERDLPFYYWLANEFAIGDRYFSSLQGPTFPNRNFLYAATSFGMVRNSIPPAEATLIVDLLSQRKVDWKIYRDASPGIASFIAKVPKYASEGRLQSMDDYFADAAAGTLPAFAFVDPSLGVSTGQWDNNDEHPPSPAQLGQRFVARVIKALAESPQWSRSALFLTYDEHGGLYDHVPPPKACPPDETAPILGSNDSAGNFDEYGVRVPFIVVSPYAKRHHVSHTIYDHTSILRFVQARFVVPALSHRDANAMAPFDLFDFSEPAPPPTLTIPGVSEAKLEVCRSVFE